VRFIPKSSDEPLIGEPVDANLDVGAATRAGKDVEVKVFSGSSILSPGSPTGKTETIGRILSPLAESEVGTIRCIGLNVSDPINFTYSNTLPSSNKTSTSNTQKKPKWPSPQSQPSS
jgi:hypothetical protein